jgi:hypothetical protein
MSDNDDGLNVEQNVNQAQAQNQEQQQAQEQGFFPALRNSVEGFIGRVPSQVAIARNQNVVVGNTGAVATGPQNATPVNVGGVSLGIPHITGSSLRTTTASDGTVTTVLTVPGVTLTIVTAPDGIPSVTVTPNP